MPIRIDNSASPASFAVSATEVQQGMENFNNHYCALSGPDYFGRDYTVLWHDFKQCIDAYHAAFPDVAEENIAIRYVHCYETATETLYMRMQLCEMQLTTVTEYSSQVYQILDNGNQMWFSLMENNIQPVPLPAQTCYDETYLNSFEYKATAAADTGEVLAEDGGFRFVRTLTYPWKNEIWQLWHDNGEPDENNTWIHFASASYTAVEPGSSSVLWPHGLVMYLQVGSQILLDDDNYVSIFHYKGADMGTACPPKCNTYVTPALTL
jgi:hypothetical protein